MFDQNCIRKLVDVTPIPIEILEGNLRAWQGGLIQSTNYDIHPGYVANAIPCCGTRDERQQVYKDLTFRHFKVLGYLENGWIVCLGHPAGGEPDKRYQNTVLTRLFIFLFNYSAGFKLVPSERKRRINWRLAS